MFGYNLAMLTKWSGTREKPRCTDEFKFVNVFLRMGESDDNDWAHHINEAED